MAKAKNIIILSEKSSGSSACQNLLTKFANIRHVAKTRHYQNETLFWTKAASILGMPQLDMVDSEVPLGRDQARNDLLSLLKDNLDDYIQPTTDKKMIMEGWTLLCKQYSPIFLEKSPHHLCQWSALELIVEYMDEEKDVDILVIGLIRNPMDTIYSQYKRWKSTPENVEKQWITAYRNLQKLRHIIGEKMLIIRYEDMVSSLNSLDPVFVFCGTSSSDADKTYFHRKSLCKWKDDKLFGFALSHEAIELAEKYGYKKEELINKSYFLWPVVREFSCVVHKISVPVESLVNTVVRKIKSTVGI